MEIVFANCVSSYLTTVNAVSFVAFNLMRSVCVTIVIRKVTMSRITFRLSDPSDWLMYENAMYKQGFIHREMMAKLCDYSLTKLINYFAGQLNGYTPNFSYYYDLYSLVAKEMTNRDFTPGYSLTEDLTISYAPLSST